MNAILRLALAVLVMFCMLDTAAADRGNGNSCKPRECKMNNGFECFSFRECKCGFYPVALCLNEPCATVRCAAGTTCVNSYCDGCNAQCVPSRP